MAESREMTGKNRQKERWRMTCNESSHPDVSQGLYDSFTPLCYFCKSYTHDPYLSPDKNVNIGLFYKTLDYVQWQDSHYLQYLHIAAMVWLSLGKGCG